MRTSIAIKQAMRHLQRAPLRSGLTLLGLSVGVSAVIAVISIGSGAKARIETLMAQMDSNRVVLSAAPPRMPERQSHSLQFSDALTIEDYLAIRRQIGGIYAISPEIQVRPRGGEVSAEGRSSKAALIGIDVEGFELDSRRLLSGTFFGPAEIREAARVCVITRTLADRLFPHHDAVGRRMHIMNTPFRIIGVVADFHRVYDPARAAEDDIGILLPYSSLLLRLFRDATTNMKINIRATTPALLPRLQTAVDDLMEQRRGRRNSVFRTRIGAAAVATFVESSRTLTWLLGCIGSISLFVGGVGIMNTMLMGVVERTREIGVRMAIGARERDVLRQFLLEALMLGILGGLAGIVLGVVAAKIVNRWNEWPTLVTVDCVLGAFLCSVAIGALFGYYPARKAARLQPLEALRAP